jgi:hypothetical protein
MTYKQPLVHHLLAAESGAFPIKNARNVADKLQMKARRLINGAI